MSSGAGAAAADAPATMSPTAESRLKDLGVVGGTLSLKGPSKAGQGSSVIFILDGPRRVQKTDASPPFKVKFNTAALPNGNYTVSVLWLRPGQATVASTATVMIKKAKPTPKPMTTPTATAAAPGMVTGTVPATIPAPSANSANSSYTAQVVALTNAERATAGCPALAINAKLTASAQAHSADMAARNYFAHESQDGRTPFDRMKANGYSYSAAAENIAMGQLTPAEVVTAWMNSAGHRANILNCTYVDIGVGYAIGNGAPYWTQDFGKPL
jgi:uncharacterized protein YkwD